MAIIASFRPRPATPLTAGLRLWSVVGVVQSIEAISRRRRFRLAAEELILELTILATKMFNLGFEVLAAMHGPSVLSLPISDLLPQFGILSPNAATSCAAQGLRDEVAAPVRTNQPARWPGVGRQACLP